MAAGTAPAQTGIRAAYDRLVRRFVAAAIPTASLDARLLVQAAAGLSHEAFIVEPGRVLPAEAAALLEGHAARRLAGEPVSRILGCKEFWGRDFLLGPETLVPRPESETLIAAALDELAAMPGVAQPLIADLGTGSGCLLVTLLAETVRARGIGTDISASALEIAEANAAAHGVGARAAFICADWLAPLAGPFDMIVSNPPYIAAGEIAALAPEVARYDPRAALDGGNDGLDAYRRIAPAAARLLRPGGVLMVEHGAGQHDQVAALLGGAGLAVDPDHGHFCDLAGHKRVVSAHRKH